MASIRKRRTSSGEFRYDVRYRAHDRQVEETFRRRKDAENRARQLEADELTGALIDPRLARETFGEYAERWLESRLVKGKPLAPMTRQGYQGLLRRNLLPTFADVAIGRITPQMVRTWYSAVSTSAGPDQAAKSYRLLRAVLNTAIEDDRIARNPCRIRGAGIEHAKERPMIDTTVVLDLANAIDPRLEALVLLAGFVGLRTGELLGLRRCDVDLASGLLHVRVQAQQVSHAGRLVTSPKSDAGRRTVALPHLVTDALEHHVDSYAQPGAEGILFTGSKGRPITRQRLSAMWGAACDAVEAPAGLRIHDLRHHAATVTARMPGITTKELMARIGHSSPRAALLYQHATEERDGAIATYLDDAIATATPALLPHRQRDR